MIITWDGDDQHAFGSVDDEWRYFVCDTRCPDDPPEKHCIMAIRWPLPQSQLGDFFWAMSRAKEWCQMNEDGGGFDHRSGVWHDLPWHLRMPS